MLLFLFLLLFLNPAVLILRVHILPSDPDWLHNFVIIPRPHGTSNASAKAFASAGASQEVRQILGFHQFQKVLLVFAALDSDLFPCFLVQEALDHGPHAREQHWRINDVHLPHNLRVVVLSDFGSQLDQSIHLFIKHAKVYASEIQNSKTLFDALACFSRTSWETQFHQKLIRLDVMLDEGLLVTQLEHFIHFHLALSLYVNGSPFLIYLVVVVRVYFLHWVRTLKHEVLYK